MNRRRAALLIASLIATFVVARIYLWFSPNSDFNVGQYNIHHLFTGLILIVAGGVPLVVGTANDKLSNIATVIFGIGLALALDEWVYLIMTDGSNESYLLPISFWGGVGAIGLAVIYTAALVFFRR